MKRILLFLATNLLVMVTISVVLNLLGVTHYLTAQGIDYTALAIFCLVWGMAGSFISLLLSKTMAKWSLGVEVVDKNDPRFGSLVVMVERLAMKAGIPTPEVGVYDSPEINAFATGPSKNNSLVAFSAGLLRAMDQEEIEGVAAHELAHVANGDMVTMTLIQGVINAFVMFFARVIAFAITNAGNREERSSPMSTYLLTMVLEIALTFLGYMVVCAFSRWREFRADAGAAQYAGRGKMIAALQRLAEGKRMIDTSQPALATMKISGGVGRFFATHPPLEDRIKALQSSRA